MPDETINSYEKRFMKQIAAQNRAVSAMFDEFSKGVTPLLARYKKPPIVTDVWLMNKEIESAINSELRTLQRRMSEFMKSEAAAAWNLSADKSDAMVNGYIKDLAVSDIAKEGLFNRNLEALKEFQSRTVNGLGLSDRVWKVCEQSKEQLELYMQSGLATGRSAANIAGDVKRYLKNPDARFRRVRDESGKLVLSKPMKDYHPGQGVYRSAYKNALRMTRTETNAAYRSADMERWKKIDFVKGYEVKLSNNHPAVDICDYLKGEYPKTFFFDGWHPNCYCYCVPVLPSQDDFVTYLNNDKLPGSPIKGIPPSAVKYIKDRSASFAGMKNKPFWLKNNFVSRNGVYYPKAGVDKPPKISGVIRENPVTIKGVKSSEFLKVGNIEDAKTIIKNIIENKSVLKVKSVMYHRDMTLEHVNRVTNQVSKLFNEYEVSKIYDTNISTSVKFVSGINFGEVQSVGIKKLTNINFGNRYDTRRANFTGKFRPKSKVDFENLDISTVTHEFTHVITDADQQLFANIDNRLVNFTPELRTIKSNYSREIKKLLKLKKESEFSDLYLGEYASKNINEFMAEAFTEYKLSSNPSKYAIEVGKLIDKYFKRP